MARSIEQNDLARSKERHFTKVLADKDDDFFRLLIEKIIEPQEEKSTELASIITEENSEDEEITTLDAEQEREKAALAEILQTYTELNQFFKQNPESIMVSTKNDVDDLRLPPGICLEDQGGPVVVEGSLVGIIGGFKNKELKPQKKTLAGLLANSLVDFAFCHSNTQIHSIAPYKKWLKSMMKKNLAIIRADSNIK